MQTISGRSVLRTASWFTLSRLFTALAAATAGVIAARELGPASRGEVAVGLLIGYGAAVALLRGLENSLSATAPGRAFEEAWTLSLSFIGSALTVATVAALTACGVVMALVTGWFAWPVAVAVASVAVGTALSRAAAAAGAASADMRRQPVITLVSGLVLVGGAVALLVLDGSTAQQWLMLYGLASMSGVLVAQLRRHSAPDEVELREVLRHNTRAGLTATTMSFLTLRADRLLLPVLAGTKELGFYVVAGTVVDLAATPAKAASQALVARWRISGVPPLGSLVALSLGVASAIAALLFVGTTWAIPLVLGADYQRSADLMIVLAPSIVGYLAARAVIARCLADGRPGLVGAAETSGLVVALVGAVALIPLYGAMGAAIASGLGYATVLVVAVFLTVRSR